tara:strand:+ start:105 stop:239 length:135 start_codon:yes stop_codon:yes gene_type:complete
VRCGDELQPRIKDSLPKEYVCSAEDFFVVFFADTRFDNTLKKEN